MVASSARHRRHPAIRIIERIDDIGAATWNDLGASPYPFLRHEFLSALETQHCLGERFGWLPRHLTLWQGDRLMAATPMYLKFNSYGEFVFDWAWADAFERSGQHYYPKLVSASPYTPATGPKILIHRDAAPGTRELLIAAGIELAQQSGVSSLHWLFSTESETDALQASGLLRRTGCQFHWENHSYTDFEHFLSTLTSAKRKNIRRERRKVTDAGVTFRLLDGLSASPEDWAVFHGLYESTFDRHGGIPTLSLSFFETIARQMPEAVLLVMAEHGGRPVAAAFCLVGSDTLYGRHWGCATHFTHLHFEACYYQGQEYCIEHGLRRFEPGAQGEHKIARGFLPTETHSAHWLADDRFRAAIRRHLEFEDAGMREYIAEMSRRSPYRSGEAT